MRVLLDTHALLWWLADDRRLGPSARRLIVDGGDDVLVSVASLFEIGIKRRIGKLDIDLGVAEHALVQDGMERLPILPGHLATLALLPLHHRDPLDVLLIVQAIPKDATLLSDDAVMIEYTVKLHRCGEH